MEIAVFWFNVFCFSLMFGAVGLSYIYYRRKREQYRLIYILYILLTAVWFVLLTYLFFIFRLMEAPSPRLVVVIAWVRIGVSVLIAYVVQLLFYALLYDSIPLRIRLVSLILPALVLFSSLGWMVFGFSKLSTAVTFLYNFGLGAGMYLVWFRLRKKPRGIRVKSMGSFLIISGTAYCFFGLYAAFFIFSGISPASIQDIFLLEAGLTGLFMFVWCFNDLLVFMRILTESIQAAKDIPDRFIRDYQISRREADVLRHLIVGKSGKEIADLLYISPRTVETHTYNIYRKCSVSNRIELLRLLQAPL